MVARRKINSVFAEKLNLTNYEATAVSAFRRRWELRTAMILDALLFHTFELRPHCAACLARLVQSSQSKINKGGLYNAEEKVLSLNQSDCFLPVVKEFFS